MTLVEKNHLTATPWEFSLWLGERVVWFTWHGNIDPFVLEDGKPIHRGAFWGQDWTHMLAPKQIAKLKLIWK